MELTEAQQRAIAAAQSRIAAKRAQPQGMASGALDSFTQGATFGFGDELTGLESAVLGRTPEGEWFNYDRPFDERYQRAVDAERGQQDVFREQNPGTALAAEVAGGLATGVGAARNGMTLMKASPSFGTTVGRGAAEGAAYAGAYGAGNADGEDLIGRIGAFGAAAPMGAATGGAVTGVLSAGQRLMNSTPKGPTTADLRRQADQKFSLGRARNPQFQGFDDFKTTARSTLDDQGFHPRNEPKVETALREIERAGDSLDFKSLEKLRKIAANAAGSSDPAERRLAKMLRDGLDEFVTQKSPMPEIVEGRQLYGRFKRAQRIENELEAAANTTASTGSGGNTDNNIRKIAARLIDPRKPYARTLPDTDKAALKAVAEGDAVRNIARLLGKLSPQGNGLMMALTGAGGMASATTGNPAFMLPMAVGMAAKPAADRMTRGAMERALAATRSGAMPQQPPLMLPDGSKAAIARLLAMGSGSISPQ